VSEVETVLFDWGDTLVRFPGVTTDRAGHLACVEALHAALRAGDHGACFSRQRIDWPRFRDAYEAAAARQTAFTRETQREHRFEERVRDTLRAAGCGCPLDEATAVAYTTRFTAILVAATRPVEGAPEVVDALSRRYRLGIVANHPWPPVVLESLERAGLRRHFATIVTSGGIGWVKPNARPFARALADLGADPARTLFVGDDLVNDVRGAKALGLHTAWLAPGRAAEPAADHHLQRISDLLAVVGA
jgi:FMN phosphatase YigB (HAD superfamily)